jgi:anaerobic selenocysteine-containing dehydrogenase
VTWDDLAAKGVWSGLVYPFAGRGGRAWHSVVGRDRLAAPKDGRFDFFSRELFSALGSPDDRMCLPHFDLPIESAQSAEYPFQLISQENMMQPRGWNGIVPTLQEAYGLQMKSRWESWVELNPEAAKALGMQDGDWVWVESAQVKVKAKVKVYPGIWPNAVHMPYGQGHTSLVQWGRYKEKGPRSFGVNPLALANDKTEPLTGLAAAMPTRVKVYRA